MAVSRALLAAQLQTDTRIRKAMQQVTSGPRCIRIISVEYCCLSETAKHVIASYGSPLLLLVLLSKTHGALEWCQNRAFMSCMPSWTVPTRLSMSDTSMVVMKRRSVSLATLGCHRAYAEHAHQQADAVLARPVVGRPLCALEDPKGLLKVLQERALAFSAEQHACRCMRCVGCAARQGAFSRCSATSASQTLASKAFSAAPP